METKQETPELLEDLESKNNSEEDIREKYKSALDLLFYEGQIAWQMNVLFVGLNVGIGTIIGNSLSSICDNSILIAVFSILGIIINIAWLGTFRRNNKYYHFRMAQARNAEPQSWKLIRKRGYNFSKGHQVIINSKGIEKDDIVHKLTSFEKWASNKLAIGVSIWIFIVGFIILLIKSSICMFQSLCK